MFFVGRTCANFGCGPLPVAAPKVGIAWHPGGLDLTLILQLYSQSTPKSVQKMFCLSGNGKLYDLLQDDLEIPAAENDLQTALGQRWQQRFHSHFTQSFAFCQRDFFSQSKKNTQRWSLRTLTPTFWYFFLVWGDQLQYGHHPKKSSPQKSYSESSQKLEFR